MYVFYEGRKFFLKKVQVSVESVLSVLLFVLYGGLPLTGICDLCTNVTIYEEF